eukprot:TRINITY_DN4201_c0_g1_i8.p1 TRINITY_DN4201_c0_g1~~TRINITY_DN4201_c0_g1_i8.p1  ORF type:complete len:107 (+),score=12.43 TRINITY_DN4201_c0_g1_i8:164-484(+)
MCIRDSLRTCSWFSRFITAISRTAELGTPLSASRSILILFSATTAPVFLSSPLYTVPYVPSPIFSVLKYRSSLPRAAARLWFGCTNPDCSIPVSYTHLTLPTKRIV